jgi:hypothetical protein
MGGSGNYRTWKQKYVLRRLSQIPLASLVSRDPVSSDELFQQEKRFPSWNHLPCRNSFNHGETNGSFDHIRSTGAHRHNLEFLSSLRDPIVASGQRDQVDLSMSANVGMPLYTEHISS